MHEVATLEEGDFVNMMGEANDIWHEVSDPWSSCSEFFQAYDRSGVENIMLKDQIKAVSDKLPEGYRKAYRTDGTIEEQGYPKPGVDVTEINTRMTRKRASRTISLL
jgi:hypothetical protein